MTDEHPSLRQAAITRIQKLTFALEEQYGITPKMGAELEMIPLSTEGKSAPGLLKKQILESALHPKYFERGYYEGMTGGRQVEYVGRPLDPLVTAESMDAAKIGSLKQSKKWGLSGISFKPAEKGKLVENNGFHLSNSLEDKAGHNLYIDARLGGLSDLSMHIADSMLDVQRDGVLAYAPYKTSYERFNSHSGFTLPKLRYVFDLGGKYFFKSLALAISGSSPIAIYNMPNKRSNFGKGLQGLINIALTEAKLFTGSGAPYSGSLATRFYPKHPERTHIENRLPGSDVDPYVATAMDLSAIYAAVVKNVERSGNAFSVKEYKDQKPPHGLSLIQRLKKLHYDEKSGDVTCLLFDPKRKRLAKSVEEARNAFEQSQNLRTILGDEFYEAVLRTYGSDQAVDPGAGLSTEVSENIFAHMAKVDLS